MSRYARVPEGLILDRNVSATALRVWARIERYQSRGKASYASREAIAEDLGMSRATVQRAITELIETGWISRRRRGGNTWETVAHQEPIPSERRLTCEPSGGSPVSRPATHLRAVTPEAATHPCTPGDSLVIPRRLTSESPKEGTELVEQNSMSKTPVARFAATNTKPSSELDDDEPPTVLVEVDPTGPTEAQITNALVGAYADAWHDAAGVPAPDRKLGAVGRNVKPLIRQGDYPMPVLLLAVQRAGARRNLDIDGQLGNAKATYDRGGQSRQALFDDWDTRIAYAATRGAAS